MKMPEKVPIRVTAVCPTQTRADVTARQHGIVIDEPEARHGTDAGMLPLEVLMASLAGCTNVIANWIARDMGIELHEVHVDVDATLDTRGITGDRQLAVPFPSIALKVALKTEASPEQMETLKEQLRWRCPVSATLRSAGSEIVETWDIDYV